MSNEGRAPRRRPGLCAGAGGVPGATRRPSPRLSSEPARPPLGHPQRQLADPRADPPAPRRPRPGHEERLARSGVAGVFGGVRPQEGELAGLEFGDVSQREGRWAIVDLVGKHGRVRTVPMPSWVFLALDEWAAAAGITSGPVLRRILKDGLVGAGLVAGRLRDRHPPCPPRRAGQGHAPRPAAHLRQARPPGSGAPRADPDLAGACLHPDYGAVFGAQTEPSRCPVRSTWDRRVGGVGAGLRHIEIPISQVSSGNYDTGAIILDASGLPPGEICDGRYTWMDRRRGRCHWLVSSGSAPP